MWSPHSWKPNNSWIQARFFSLWWQLWLRLDVLVNQDLTVISFFFFQIVFFCFLLSCRDIFLFLFHFIYHVYVDIFCLGISIYWICLCKFAFPHLITCIWPVLIPAHFSNLSLSLCIVFPFSVVFAKHLNSVTDLTDFN